MNSYNKGFDYRDAAFVPQLYRWCVFMFLREKERCAGVAPPPSTTTFNYVQLGPPKILDSIWSSPVRFGLFFTARHPIVFLWIWIMWRTSCPSLTCTDVRVPACLLWKSKRVQIQGPSLTLERAIGWLVINVITLIYASALSWEQSYFVMPCREPQMYLYLLYWKLFRLPVLFFRLVFLFFFFALQV